MMLKIQETLKVCAGLELPRESQSSNRLRQPASHVLQLTKPGLELLNFSAPQLPQIASSARHRGEPSP